MNTGEIYYDHSYNGVDYDESTMGAEGVHCGYAYDEMAFDEIRWDPQTKDIIIKYSNNVPQIVHGVECVAVEPLKEKQIAPIKKILEDHPQYIGIFFAENKMFMLNRNGTCSAYSGSAANGPVETWNYELFDIE